MPAPPGMSDEEYRKHKVAEKEKQQLKSAKRTYEGKYGKKYDPTPKVDELDADGIEKDWMKPGDWVAGWGMVEFDADACLKNVTDKGKAKDGFFAPAGTNLPLGAALPEMTVLKYGGYFPAGTSFPGGVMVPLHARMVNLLPQATIAPGDPWTSESLCSIQ